MIDDYIKFIIDNNDEKEIYAARTKYKFTSDDIEYSMRNYKIKALRIIWDGDCRSYIVNEQLKNDNNSVAKFLVEFADNDVMFIDAFTSRSIHFIKFLLENGRTHENIDMMKKRYMIYV